MAQQLGPRPGQEKVSLPALQSTKNVRGGWATILFYAIARFGKTEMLRGLQAHGFKPLIISTEKGQSRGLRTVSDLDIPFVPVDDWEVAKVVFAQLKKGKYQDYEFDLVFVDSLTGFGEIWMKKGLEVLGWSEVGVGGEDHITGTKKDTRRIYQYIPEKGHQTMDALFDIPAHLVCVCREGLQSEEVDGKVVATYPVPELPGQKLNRELPGWPDATVYGKFLNGERIFLTEPEGKTIAGVRMPKGMRFPKRMKADLGLLIKGMQGDLEAIKQAELPKKEK